ncbi:hypothetical protein EGI20_03715 [Aquitalea sp. S1-19]|nr:hypothetical protein [Aquitalea sp. S1-19]
MGWLQSEYTRCIQNTLFNNNEIDKWLNRDNTKNMSNEIKNKQFNAIKNKHLIIISIFIANDC